MKSVDAALTYAVDTGGRDADGRLSTGEYRDYPAVIRDGRSRDFDFSLEREGFVLVSHNTRVTDFLDNDEVNSVYFSEVEDLIRRQTGGSRVVPFGRLRRSGNETKRAEKRLMAPVKVVHNDFTQWSGPQTVHEKLPQEADALLDRRVAIIQVWRPVDQEIRSTPLAVCDAQSVAPEDFLIAVGRRGDEIVDKPGSHHSRAAKGYYEFGYNRAHRWFYFPRMRPDEALLFKTYDSEIDGRARFTPHGSFQDSTDSADAAPRENFDLRALVFF